MPFITMAGISGFFIDGSPWNLGEDLSYTPDRIEWTAVEGQMGMYGTKGLGKGGEINTTIVTNSGTDLSYLAGITSSQIAVQLRDGRVIVGTNCSVIGPVEEDAAASTVKIKFMGSSIRVTPV